MKKIELRKRLYASTIHTSASLIIIGLLFVVVYFRWYPAGLIAAGAIQGFTILILVDLVLGPLITFVIYDEKKKSLKFDLLCIIIVQLGFFLYGAKLIFDERPVFNVLADDGMHLFTSSDLDKFAIDVETSFLSPPLFHYMNLPEDLSTIVTSKIAAEITSGKPFALKTELYAPSAEEITDQEFAIRLTLIDRVISDSEKRQLNFINSLDESDVGCIWVPVRSKHTEGFVCITKEDGITSFTKTPEIK